MSSFYTNSLLGMRPVLRWQGDCMGFDPSNSPGFVAIPLLPEGVCFLVRGVTLHAF